MQGNRIGVVSSLVTIVILVSNSPASSIVATSAGPQSGPVPDCVSRVWQDLEACGWPGPSNTGYPAGAVFTRTVEGTYTVTTDNAVIDTWRITGGVEVNAKNVVIRNSWI